MSDTRILTQAAKQRACDLANAYGDFGYAADHCNSGYPALLALAQQCQDISDAVKVHDKHPCGMLHSFGQFRLPDEPDVLAERMRTCGFTDDQIDVLRQVFVQPAKIGEW